MWMKIGLLPQLKNCFYKDAGYKERKQTLQK